MNDYREGIINFKGFEPNTNT